MADQEQLRHLHTVRATHEVTGREKLREALDLTKNMHNEDEEELVRDHQARMAEQHKDKEARELELNAQAVKLARHNGAKQEEVFMGPHPGYQALPGGRVNQYVRVQQQKAKQQPKAEVSATSEEDAEYNQVVNRAQSALLQAETTARQTARVNVHQTQADMAAEFRARHDAKRNLDALRTPQDDARGKMMSQCMAYANHLKATNVNGPELVRSWK